MYFYVDGILNGKVDWISAFHIASYDDPGNPDDSSESSGLDESSKSNDSKNKKVLYKLENKPNSSWTVTKLLPGLSIPDNEIELINFIEQINSIAQECGAFSRIHCGLVPIDML